MSEPGPESRLWGLARGALAARALALAADLRVAHALAGGARPVAEVAAEVGADADTLHRLLRALATEGVFAEEAPGVFRNTAASDALRRDGWEDVAHFFGGVWHRAAGELDASGAPTFERVFGTGFWTWLAERPEERAAFDRSMEQGWERRVERLASLGWRGDETVVDVGGGNGSLLVELLRVHPGLRGVVFDLPETSRDEHALGERIAFVGGDFFRSVPSGGDVYVLSTILHDWDDERAEAILRSVHAASPGGARLVLLEAVLAPGNEPHGGKWLDLLLLAQFGGRERDEAQWRTLLARAGFEPTAIRDGLIEARWR